MIDTIRLKSPPLEESEIDVITRYMCRKSCVDLGSGVVEYELISGSLAGSFDHRIMCRVEREHWHKGYKVACKPYVVLEGSVHKALLGHNVYGGPDDFRAACRWLVYTVGDSIGVHWHCADSWEVLRVDWAECFHLGSAFACAEYIHGLNLETFPRRDAPTRYGKSGIYSKGSVTVKVYHKGVEFRKHDARRLLSVMPEEVVNHIQAVADCVLRAEVELSSRWLRYRYGRLPLVCEVLSADLRAAYATGMGKLIKESRGTMDTVRQTELVRDRLYSLYNPNKASLLFATWLQFSALGEDKTRLRMARATFYRQRKCLVESGCSWTCTDVSVGDLAVPSGLNFGLSSSYRLSDVSSCVASALADFTDCVA